MNKLNTNYKLNMLPLFLNNFEDSISKFPEKKFFLLIFLISISSSSFGAKKTWNASSGNWFVATNWVGGVVPVSGDDVEILNGGTCTIPNTGITPVIKKLKIENANSKLIVKGTLNISGNSEGIFIKSEGFLRNVGTTNVTATSKEGIKIESEGQFTNKGTLNITSEKEGIKMKDDDTFFINDGLIDIKDTNNKGISMDNGASTFTNNAGKTIKIGSTAAVKDEGIKLKSDAVFNNFGNIQIINATKDDKLKLENNAKFNNESGAVLEVSGNGTVKLMGSGVTFKCEGIFEPGGAGDIGILTISTSVDLSKATINTEVAGTNSADQVIVNGTTTLGGTSTLNVSTINSYQISVGDQYNLLNSNTSTSGTFATENLPGCCAWTLEYLGSNQEILTITALTALPVELMAFRGNLQNENTFLSWETASEINNAGFEIEHSSDGDKWEIIGFVNGNLTTNNVNYYHFRDLHPSSGLNYYRLKQMDLDGGFEYSNTIVVELKNKTNPEILVYPSPASEKINIHSSIFDSQRTDLKIVNSVGQVILSELIPSSEDRTTKVIDISTYEKGIYFVIISNGTESYSSNFVVIYSK